MKPSRLLLAVGFLILSGCASFPQPKPITTDQVVQMSQSGVASAEIIKRLEASGTIYSLSAAELVRLHGEGVPDEVLNYMQSTYIGEIRRQERMYNWPPRYGFYGPYYYPHYYRGGYWPYWPHW